MGLDGGGGGGGIVGVGNSFTGAAQALEVQGNHIYGYSGLVNVDDNETDLLNALTGNYYCEVKILFEYAEDEPRSDDFIYRVRLNDAIIWLLLVPHSEAHYSMPTNVNIIIPPYTRVRCTAINDDSSTERSNLVVLAGRIYRD